MRQIISTQVDFVQCVGDSIGKKEFGFRYKSQYVNVHKRVSNPYDGGSFKKFENFNYNAPLVAL